jgi:hypothetical protein
MRRIPLLVPLLVGFVACGRPTEVATHVSLDIDHVAARADGRALGYRYTITNASRDSVWIAACGGVIRPDVAVMVRERRVDAYGGSLCLANVDMGPAAIAPGASYRGESAVQLATGATFVPSVTVSQTRRSGGATRQVVGAAFGAL